MGTIAGKNKLREALKPLLKAIEEVRESERGDGVADEARVCNLLGEIFFERCDDIDIQIIGLAVEVTKELHGKMIGESWL